jgi:hypothetical protein
MIARCHSGLLQVAFQDGVVGGGVIMEMRYSLASAYNDVRT